MGQSRGQSPGFEWFSGSRTLGHKRKGQKHFFESTKSPVSSSPFPWASHPPSLPPALPPSLLSYPSTPSRLSVCTDTAFNKGGMGCSVYLCGARLKTSPLIDIPVTLSNNGASNFLEIDVCPPQGKTQLLAFTHPWMTYTCASSLSVCVCARARSCLCQREKLHEWSSIGRSSVGFYCMQ